eukprot:Gb_23048 [translate_table: standard]
MNYRFKNLLGAPYRGGNAILSNNTHLLSPVGNRVSVIDLVKSETITLPCENTKNITRIAVSPDGILLLSVDEDGKCLLINLHRRVILHRISFKHAVTAIKFSHDGSLFAVALGKLIQVWRTPGFRKEFVPFELVRSLPGCHDSVTTLDWSPDGQWILAGSKDLTARLFSSSTIEGYRPFCLLGHRDVLVGVFFTVEKTGRNAGRVNGAYTISKDGAIFSWKFYLTEEEESPQVRVNESQITANKRDEDLGGLDKKRKWEDEEDAEDLTVIMNSNKISENAKTLNPVNTPDSVKTLDAAKTLSHSENISGKDNQKKKKRKTSGGDETHLYSGRIQNHSPSKTDVDTKDMVKSDNDGNKSVVLQSGLLKSKHARGEPVFPLHKGQWELSKKDFFMQSPANLTACDYQSGLNLVVVGFSSGIFGIYQMPEFTCIHLLSISREKITTAVFNVLGNWLAFGCAKLGQLLVWEWRSETYILKQQGHYFDVNCLAYSPDSQLLATGADDNKVKVWTVSSGFCFVTFAEHTNAVTAVHFLPGNHALLSASMDGTVRAWDLFRYRNFRTFTTPSAKQFVSLAADQSGEVICAGTLDSFEIFVWSMKTGRLLDVLSGHEGPVHGLAFSPTHAILASSSWDKTVRLWDVFDGKGAVEKFSHTHDVLTVTYRPDGKQLACSTLDGQIYFWDPIEGELMWTIEGRRDIAGGRLMGDRRTAANSSSGKCFTSLCYSADGSYIIAGGSSKYICMYDVAEQVLLRRFQITSNLSLDGVLDFLNSKGMTDGGPLGLIDDEDSDLEEGMDRQTRGQLGYGLPGTTINYGRPVVSTKCLRISSTGRSWAAATTEGVLMYSMDDSFVFDPTDLDIDVTPEAVDAALGQGQHLRALVLALRLNEASLIRKCVLYVPPKDVVTVAAAIPSSYLRRLFEVFAEYLESSPHLEFLLQWCQELCKAHGQTIQQHCKDLLPALRSLQKALTRLHQDLADTCSSNEYLLQYLCSPSSHC